ncbi:MAG: twin-arginine translocase subunit TatC [Acidobacteria bacterium]|nr:twin-arginine translocase subunit TatC [Acidobacteriota bacterium]
MESDERQPGVDTPEGEATPTLEESPAPLAVTGGAGASLPPGKSTDEGEDDDEEGMVRMSFLEHLEELRKRLILALAGIGVSFALSLLFANQIWKWISAPAIEALKNTGADPNLVFLQPTEAFAMIWMKAPMLVSIFLAAPWILYQVWAFIAPGLYKRERRWAVPFVLTTAGLFILGGAFAYFVAFRFALAFLLSIGRDIGVKPMITATYYFDLFVNVTLGIGLVFELPVLLFFLTLLRIASPRFLMRNVRYAILAIAILAAVVTPTPDIFNMMIFAVPMWGLFFVGVFASYLLVLHREKRRFPWKEIRYGLFVVLVVMAGLLYLAVTKYGYHLLAHWPFLTR